MEIRVERLRQVLALVAPAVAKRGAALPITRNVLIANGQVRATNLEVSVAAPIPEAGENNFTLPFNLVRDSMTHLPSYEVIHCPRCAR
jgi:hypothetical protein